MKHHNSGSLMLLTDNYNNNIYRIRRDIILIRWFKEQINRLRNEEEIRESIRKK